MLFIVRKNQSHIIFGPNFTQNLYSTRLQQQQQQQQQQQPPPPTPTQTQNRR
jgi:hypothetical protein